LALLFRIHGGSGFVCRPKSGYPGLFSVVSISYSRQVLGYSLKVGQFFFLSLSKSPFLITLPFHVI